MERKMMRFQLRISILSILLLITLQGVGQETSGKGTLILFTDRNYCLSGDTVWFSVLFPPDTGLNTDVVHIQMTTPSGRVVSSVMKKRKEFRTDGFIPVSDSLQTGGYLLNAFIASIPSGSFSQSVLFVYNRFDRNITRMDLPSAGELISMEDYSRRITVGTDRQVYRLRDTVRVKVHSIGLPGPIQLMVGAVLSDPLANRFTGFRISESAGFPSAGIKKATEPDGFFIYGRVSEANSGNPASGAKVLFSIGGKSPYFDYSIADTSGNFRFFLKNAFGTGKAFIQAYNGENHELRVELTGNSDQKPATMKTKAFTLSAGETEFAGNLAEAGYFRKLFGSTYLKANEPFFLPQQYPVPFFGKPDLVVKTADFVSLPDFAEISRELLPGVKYRLKEGLPVLRMVNSQKNDFFEEEPLKLINGVPVFDNKFISRLNSSDIESISCVIRERVFGDLIFRGVLSFQMKEGSDAWLSDQPGTFQCIVQGLQSDKIPSCMAPHDPVAGNQPDLRNVYYWSPITLQDSTDFFFITSDMKGEIEITVKGISPQNQPFVTGTKIRVQ